MSEELKSLAIEIWGARGYSAALASALHIHPTQVWRYLTARTPVPGPVQAAMECWIANFRATGKRP